MHQEQTSENLIEEIIAENKIYRFASELQGIEDETRKTQLRNILAILQRCDKNTKEEKEEATQQKLGQIFAKEAEFALKKSWGKLNESQRTNRIKYYISKMIMDTPKKQEYEKKVLDLQTSKKLKKTQVVYDEKIGEIITIDVEI